MFDGHVRLAEAGWTDGFPNKVILCRLEVRDQIRE